MKLSRPDRLTKGGVEHSIKAIDWPPKGMTETQLIAVAEQRRIITPTMAALLRKKAK